MVPKGKTRRGCRGGGNEQREESDILWYASARIVLLQGWGREKDREGAKVDCGRWGWKDVKWLGKNDDNDDDGRGGGGDGDVATKSESTRWGDGDDTARWEEKNSSSFFLSRFPRFRWTPDFKEEFNLCKFITHEHFTVLPVKIVKRDSSSRSFELEVILNRGVSSCVFPKTCDKRRANDDDGERSYVLRHDSWLKVPTVLSRRCARSLHARPRKPDAANTAFVPFLDLFSLISAWSVKNGAKRTGRTSV